MATGGSVAEAYALIVLRDNVIAAMSQYNDAETSERISRASSLLEQFVESVFA